MKKNIKVLISFGFVFLVQCNIYAQKDGLPAPKPESQPPPGFPIEAPHLIIILLILGLILAFILFKKVNVIKNNYKITFK